MYLELKINDPNKYFRRSAVNADQSITPSDLPAFQAATMSNSESRTGIVDTQLALSALEEMMSGACQDGGLDEEYGLPRNPATGAYGYMCC